MSRKAIALEFIFLIIIALVGVALLLILLGGPVRDMMQNTFCYFYQSILGQTADFCEQINEPPTKVSICEHKGGGCDVAVKDTEELTRTIAAYSIICWKEKRLTVTNTTICNTILLNTHPGNITESYLTKLMEKENGCNVLENSIVITERGDNETYSGDCGTNDNIFWDVSGNIISDQKLILIKYDTNINKVAIKA